MSIVVVVAFEVVDIDHQQAQSVSATRCPQPLGAQDFVEPPAVGDAGQSVGRGLARQLRVGLLKQLLLAYQIGDFSPCNHRKTLAGAYFVGMNPAVVGVPLQSRLRIGAAFSDAGLRPLVAETRPGLDERELAAIVEGAYVKFGGTTMIHYIGVTAMAQPHLYVPPQYPSPRKVRSGDIVSCELSAYWWDYPGQVLRTFTVDAEATPQYCDLHATAEATFDAVTRVVRHGATMQEILDATGLIESRGYTVCDDLMHGFGGGYFQPIIGTRSRMAGALTEMTLEENMTVVVQPNVITTGADESKRAGVQVGEMIRVTRDGFERLHRAPRGMFRSGQVI